MEVLGPPKPLHDVPLVAALRLASFLLVLVIGLAALRSALALFDAGNRAIGIVWLVSGVLLVGVVIAINERIVSTVRMKSQGGMRLAQAYLWVKGAVGIVAAFKFTGLASVLGWVLVATALSGWLVIRSVRGRSPD
jgi:hypothetical protein